MKWEYDIVQRRRSLTQDELNYAGSEGWELISVVSVVGNQAGPENHKYYFKRQIPEAEFAQCSSKREVVLICTYNGLTPEQKILYDRRSKYRKAKWFNKADIIRYTLERQDVNVLAIDSERLGSLK